jgi:hypothetical protein
MGSENQLSPFHQRVLQGYKCRRKPRGRIHDKNAHVTIRTSVLHWLARDDIQESYRLDELTVSETVALIDVIVAHDQTIRTKKTQDTIEGNKKRHAGLVLKERQLRMDL